MDSPTLRSQFGLTACVVEKNAESLDHAESSTQPSPGGNCANWVLGHIVRARNEALAVMGRESLYPSEKYSAFGNDPVTSGAGAVTWNELLEDFRALQKPLDEGLAGPNPEVMQEAAPFSPTGNPDETIGSLLVGFAFHEAYHAGQLGVLRRIVGKAGALKAPAAEPA